MKQPYLLNRYFAVVLCLLLFFSLNSFGQRMYATSQANGNSGILCVGCGVTNPTNAIDGNLQTSSTLTVPIGLGGSQYQELIFPAAGKVAANTPVTVKLGSGDKLLSLTALGSVTLQAYNGSTAIGTPVAASTLLSALSNNNEVEVSITPTAIYDRIRVTLNGGLLSALASYYVYEAFYNGTGTVACNNAIDELDGISSGLLGLGASIGGVVNPQLAYDGNLTTASTLNAGVGLVGATAQETIIYQSASTIGDSVKITLGFPSALIAAGVTSNVSVTTFNGNTSNNDTQTITSGLLTLQLLNINGGIQMAVVTVVPTKIFDRVQITLGGGIANVLSSLNLYEAQKINPSPVVKYNGVVTNSVSLCAGSTATLTVNAVTGTTYNWYTAATGGAPVGTGTSFTTPTLNTTTTYYVDGTRTGCTDPSGRTAVVITVNQIPAAPVIANSAITVCPGQTGTFSAQAVTGATVNWYTAPTGGTPVFTGNNFTTPALTATTTYYAEAVAGGTCVSPTRTAVTATVNPLPASPTLAANNVTICDGNVAVFSISSPVSGITYNWYSAATGGTLLGTGTNFTSPVLHATTNYYVEGVNATGCTSAARTQATATVQPLPADPTLSTNNTTINAGQTATLTVTNAQTGITYNWYTSATASTPVATGSSYTTPALYSNTTYYASAVNSTGCTSTNRTAITINVTTVAAACTFASQQSSNINGLCIGCGVTNNNLAIDGDTTTASTISVGVGLVGAYAEQQLVFQQPGIAGDVIKLGIQTPVSLATVGLLGQVQVILYNGATQVSTTTLDANTLKITLLGGGDKAIAYIPATGAYDRISVRLTSGAATALSSLQVLYAIQQFQAPVISPASPEICAGSPATLSITSPGVGTFAWYTTPTGGAAVATGTSFTTPNLSANTTYYVEYSRNGCVSPQRFAVPILIDNPPAAPTASVSVVTINSGQTATLSATAPAGATINWYAASTGGTSLGTGNSFTTPALNANTTYYAESSLGSCVSPTRTPVTVTVNAVIPPDVTVTPATQAVDPGNTATMTATSTTPGAVFNWYATPTGGTSLLTGATFTTPAIFANTTYYAEASVPATGAVSTGRSPGVVTLNSTTVSATPCDAAISQTTDINGLICLGCAVNNAAGAVDADRNTFSQLSVPVGLLNAYAGQTLRFATTGMAGDSVIVELGVPGSLADVTVLSNISLATYNGTTYNNDRFNVNPSLLSVSLLSGTSRFRVAFAATAAFDRVEIRLNSTVGVLNSLNVYDAYEEVPAPTVATSTVTTCQGSQATLTATAPSNVTVKWYNTPTGGTPLFTGTIFNTPALTASTIYYAEASRTADGCTQTVRTPVNVTVTPLPSAPVVTNPAVTVCSGQPATFNATPVTGVSFSWYSSPTGGTALATGNSFTSPALTATTSYYVEADGAGGCANSTRTQVTANVNAALDNAQVTQSPTQICAGGSAVLTATSTLPGVTFNWYTAATGGTPIFTGAQFTTPALTANTAYFVEVASGTCVSPSRTEADVTVNPAPANPTVVTVPAGGQVSSGQSATITASSTTPGATFNWYTSATGGTPIFTGATFTTPALSSNATYYVEAANASGCTSPQRTAVTITVAPIFSTSCDFVSSETTDVNGGLLCIGCSVSNDTFAADADTTNFSQLNLPIAVLNSYVAQQLIFSNTGNAGDDVSVKIAVPAGLATVGVLNQLQIASYNGATYNNDRINLSSNLISIQVLSGGTTAIVHFKPAATFDRVEIRLSSTIASVLNAVDIYYASMQVAAPQLNANAVNICANNTATFTIANPAADVTYTWYDAATGGNIVGTGTSFTTPVLTATTTYYAQASRTSNSCPNPNRTAATVNVSPGPANPVLAANNVQICAGSQAVLSVTNANGATVNWYDAATGGNLLFTGAAFAVSPVTNASYYAEISNGTCASTTRAQATVTVNPRPANPGVVSANVSVCAGSTAVLQINAPEAGVTYNWYAAATGGTALASGTSFTTPAITQNTTYYVEAANTATGCINTGGRTAVNVTPDGTISAPTLSANQTQVCAGGSATISVVNPVSGITYNWYTAASGGTQVFTGTTFTANNLTANVSYFVDATSSTGCVSATRTETDIAVQPAPAAPTVQAAAGGSLNGCSGSVTTVSIANPDANLVYRWFDAATSGNLLYTGTQFTTPPLTATTTYYVEAAAAGNCNASTRTAVTINVSPLPPDPTVTANNVLVCSGSSATLSVASPQAGISYQWYDSPSKTNLLFTGTTYITGAITNTTNFYVSASNATGCSSANLAQVQVGIQTTPAAPAIANGSVVTVCSGSAITLAVANPQTGYTYNWYTSASGGSSVFTGSSFTVNNVTANVSYFVDATNVSGCISATRGEVDITVQPLPTAPVVQIPSGGFTICSGSTATINISAPQAGITYAWYDAATGGNLVNTGTVYTTPALTATTTYYVEAQAAGNCNSSTRTAVMINVSPIPNDPNVASTNVLVCNGASATLIISTPQAGVSYNWYDSAAKTNLLFTGTSYVTPSITSAVNFYVSASNAAGCNSANVVQVAVNIQPAPSAPVVANGAAVTACSGSTVTLTIANPSASVVYNWYSTATGGTIIATGTSFTTAALTANVSYFAEATNTSGCASSTRTETDITVQPIPTAPVVNVPVGGFNDCSGSTITIAISSPQAGITYTWYDAAAGGNLVNTGTSYTTPALTANATYYIEADAAGNCNSSTRTPVTINVSPIPIDPTVTANSVLVCSGTSATLSVSNPQAGVSYNWYDSAAKTNLLYTGTTYITAPVTAMTNYYVSAVNTSGCSSVNTAQVQVNVQPAPAAPAIANGSSTATCSGSTVTLTIANPQPGYTYNWYTTATGGSSVATGTQFVTPPITSGTTYYAEAVNSTGCSSATRTSVGVGVNPAPAAPTVSSTGTIVCPGTSTTLTATSSDVGATINWYATATGGTVLASGNSFTTGAISSTTTFYVGATSGVNGCISATRTPVTITLATPLNAPVVSVSNTTASSVTFVWIPVTGATAYQVSTDNGITFTNIGNSPTYTASSLRFNTKVTLIVQSLGATSCQTSANSSAVTGTATNPLDDGIFVPNAFTPNGDGKNDILYVFGVNIKGLNLWIYDQWGELQFKSPLQSSGWDGTYKGRNQPTGVYVYYLEATMNDGRQLTKKGTITLLR